MDKSPAVKYRAVIVTARYQAVFPVAVPTKAQLVKEENTAAYRSSMLQAEVFILQTEALVALTTTCGCHTAWCHVAAHYGVVGDRTSNFSP